MTRQEALERLCKLTEKAFDHIGHSHATDCFCGKGGFHRDGRVPDWTSYLNDGAAIEFIEAAVSAHIERERSVAALPCPFCGHLPVVAVIGLNVICETPDCPLADGRVPLALWNRRSPDTWVKV